MHNHTKMFSVFQWSVYDFGIAPMWNDGCGKTVDLAAKWTYFLCERWWYLTLVAHPPFNNTMQHIQEWAATTFSCNCKLRDRFGNLILLSYCTMCNIHVLILHCYYNSVYWWRFQIGGIDCSSSLRRAHPLSGRLQYQSRAQTPKLTAATVQKMTSTGGKVGYL